MSHDQDEVRVVCTDRGQHPSTLLARMYVNVILDNGDRRALCGEDLAAYRAGAGPYSGRPSAVAVVSHTTRFTDSAAVTTTTTRTTVRRVTRRDGRQSYVFRCNRCRREARVSESDLRRLAEVLAVVDISQLRR